jgi:hypothetical protein
MSVVPRIEVCTVHLQLETFECRRFQKLSEHEGTLANTSFQKKFEASQTSGISVRTLGAPSNPISRHEQKNSRRAILSPHGSHWTDKVELEMYSCGILLSCELVDDVSRDQGPIAWTRVVFQRPTCSVHRPLSATLTKMQVVSRYCMRWRAGEY